MGNQRKKIIIIGGGVTGLAAAYRFEIEKLNAEVALLEATNYYGGKAQTEHVAGFNIEVGADSILSRKPRGVGLCEELGITDLLIGRRPENKQTFVKRDGRLHNLPEGLSGMVPTNLDALKNNTLISDAGRERLAQEVNIPPRPGDDDESLESFMIRRMGEEVYRQLIEPLMSGIYGGNGAKLSLLSTFPQLRDIEKKHGSLLAGLTQGSAGAAPAKYPPFVSFRGGMGDLPNGIVSRLKTTRLIKNAQVSKVSHNGRRYTVTLNNGETEQADGIILAIPAHVTSKITTDFQPEFAAVHGDIPHGSSVTLTLGYKRSEIEHPLNGYGYVIPRVEDTEVLASTWTSSKWENRAPEDMVAIRVFLGKHGRRYVLDDADEDLAELAKAELKKTLGITARPILQKVYRWKDGMPQYVLGHLERVTKIENIVADLNGFAVAGAPYRGVGIPDCIRSGEQAADKLIKEL